MTLAASRQQAASRPRLLQAVFDAVQQPDIRKKLLFTAAMLVIFRFTAHRFSASARQKIEAAGGSCNALEHDSGAA